MEMNRRKTIALGAGGVAALIGTAALAQTAPATTTAPAAAPAAPVTPGKTAEQWIAEFTGGAGVTEGGVELTAPEIAENGNTVPVSVAADGASEVLLVATGNPVGGVMIARFGPAAGRREIATRIRLARTQDIIGVAKMEDGTFRQATANVKVTIGGCGG
ncbi:thiosulfate oxidation carrier protein SoxY [Paracoccus luteus]|uniref:thiosulfate oxidation carrier protein SoxY n=1 Tax=Paracoccus luteus TaxID=2508543 RepID=UPI00106F4D31|nr:thiosulfate oxidation carrier protein SoxY [Paracoccus luteus]